MGINQSDWHKRRLTGGKKPSYRKKRKFELGRQSASTKLGANLVRPVRCMGGLIKKRAIRLDSGNVSWASEGITRKCRVLGVVYNASDNDLVRTNTLVKSCIIQVDATRFKEWYEQYYGVVLGGKKKATKADTTAAAAEGEKKEGEKKEGEKKEASTTTAPATTPAEGKTDAAGKAKLTNKQIKHAKRTKTRQLEQGLEEQFATGRLLVCVSSRPGQVGRCDGYVLEGKELDFYQKKMQKKRS